MCLTLRVRNVLFAAVAAVAAVAVVSAGSGVPASARPVAAAAARQAAATGREQPRSELLINGDRLEVTGGKAKDVAVVPAGSGFASSVLDLRFAGKTYTVPDAALPFLGRGLPSPQTQPRGMIAPASCRVFQVHAAALHGGPGQPGHRARAVLFGRPERGGGSGSRSTAVTARRASSSPATSPVRCSPDRCSATGTQRPGSSVAPLCRLRGHPPWESSNGLELETAG
jgi:hypothetical protein